MTQGNIAIVHKHYPERGGAEYVADELARTFDAPVYTGVADPSALADDVDVRELFGDSVLAPVMRKPSMPWQAIRDAYYVFGWDYCPELAEYDILIESGMAPWWYVPQPHQTVIRYVHSPPRMPYDRYQDVGNSMFVRAYSRIVRHTVPDTASYGDQYIANSEAIARRLEQSFDISSDHTEIVYPPVDTTNITPQESTGDYYLGLSRLAPAKRFGEVIHAFGRHHPDKQLRIAGDGSDRHRLEGLASKYENVELLGRVSESEKADLLADARALVYNAHQEDFGMVPVEAFAAGTPVIGVREGFTQHQIQDGWNGLTYDRGIRNLAHAITRFSDQGVTASPGSLADLALQCRPRVFRTQMERIVEDTVERTSVEASSWGSVAQFGEGPHLQVAEEAQREVVSRE